LPAYRLPSPYDRPPLRRRASGLALALGINLLLFLALLGLGKFAPMAERSSRGLVVGLLPDARDAAPKKSVAVTTPKPPRENRPVPKPPPIILPVKPTIAAPPPLPWIELSKEDMAAAEITHLPKATGDGSGGNAGDSEAVGRGPNGETLYAAEWARRPTDAELGGYLPANAPDGYGLVACKTVPDNRVDDCVELGQEPLGSHLARAVRLAAWQFRVRPPRKNGKPMIGEWVRIRIDYEHVTRDSGG
jgi:protein TonB